MPATETLVRQKLARLPQGPGVYQFFNEAHKLLYIGKAKSLEKRVKSYFLKGRGHSLWTKHMVTEIADIEYIQTDTEQEAILLEAHLIREHQPKFNIRLRDDKSYLYLRISEKDQFPTLTTTRRIKRDGARYFGPLSSQKQVKDLLRGIRLIFPFRTALERPQKAFEQPIRDYMRRRYGLDETSGMDDKLWRGVIDEIIVFLDGNYNVVIRRLETAMNIAAKEEDFELAASLRDQLTALQRLADNQKIASTKGQDEDIIGFASSSTHVMANVFTVRLGRLISRTALLIDREEAQPLDDVVQEFVRRYYAQAGSVPKKVAVSEEPIDIAGLSQDLSILAAKKIEVCVPQRGPLRKLADLASRNAQEALELARLKWLAEGEKQQQSLEELQSELALIELPRRIECFDNSTFQGSSSVASMVVFTDGLPNRKHYRRFAIKSVDGVDDFAMMREVLTRRFGNRTAKKSDESFESDPDLIIIDGGKGQLTAAKAILEEKGVTSPVVGLAKRDEEIFIPAGEGFTRIYLPRHSAALFLIQRIRDEAHRFAITYHRNLRSKQQHRSVLDELPGVGPVTKRKLLRTFSSLKGIKAASEEALAEVVGPAKAKQLREQLTSL